ncbi:hypothetical protein L218DRAFT_854942, partial [Marasmius fiardii PR-910]
PEPNHELAPEYRETGVEIGDVGVLRSDGIFDFVFNVCRSSEDSVNQGGVPNDFQPLIRNVSKRVIPNVFRPGQPVLSAGAGIEAIHQVCSTSRLGYPPPNGAASVDSRNLAVFHEYVERHSAGWYTFVNEKLGMEIGNRTMYFITGFDKMDCWENAVYASKYKGRS